MKLKMWPSAKWKKYVKFSRNNTAGTPETGHPVIHCCQLYRMGEELCRVDNTDVTCIQGCITCVYITTFSSCAFQRRSSIACSWAVPRFSRQEKQKQRQNPLNHKNSNRVIFYNNRKFLFLSNDPVFSDQIPPVPWLRSLNFSVVDTLVSFLSRFFREKWW